MFPQQRDKHITLFMLTVFGSATDLLDALVVDRLVDLQQPPREFVSARRAGQRPRQKLVVAAAANQKQNHTRGATLNNTRTARNERGRDSAGRNIITSGGV